MFDDERVLQIAEREGLPLGRLIATSKSAYRRANPSHYPVFNAYLVDDAGRPLWSGDLDLTGDEGALVAIARERGIALHVLHEGDLTSFRGNPGDVGNAAITIEPDGTVDINPEARPPVVRHLDGRLGRAV